MERSNSNEDVTIDRIFYSSNYSLWIRISSMACWRSSNLFENSGFGTSDKFGWPKEFGFGFDSISRHLYISISLRI